MATYVSTIKFSEQGFKSIKDTTKRAAAIRVATKKMGIKVISMYWTLGAYDGLLILEAPDDETATGFLLKLGAEGNVHTTTVRAFNAGEMDSILQKMQRNGK
jgi:uncharacterized protein with GYD domain